jgi:hypothetical protein
MMQVLLTLLPYVSVVATALATLGLFWGVNRNVQKLRRSVQACENSVQAEAAQLTNAMNELKREFAELEKAEEFEGCPEPAGAGLRALARSKVLKMRRAGQTTEQIAETLRLPKAEVELLIKVQQIVIQHYEYVTSPAGLVGAKKD